jgi:peptidoglycan hydrolase-like protein with peptidoglycan-binding domain
MSNLFKSKFLLGVVLVAVLVVAGGAFAKPVAADCSIITTLRLGSSGTQVMCLQTALGGLTADGNFGPLTKAAVVSWQSKSGLVADGIFGPKSNAVWMANAGNSANFPAGCTSASGYSVSTGLSCAGSGGTYPAGCMSAVGYSPTTGAKCDGVTTTTPSGPLAGSAGTIADVNNLSAYNNEEVGDGSNDLKVAGFEVETSNDGDIQLNSVKVSFASTGNGATESDRIEDYLDSVSIWQGSTKVGSADTADFNKDSTGNYSKVITLSNSVVRSDTLEKFYIAVDAVNNLDSGDIVADSWSVDLENIRYTDGSGVTTTDTSSGVINAMNVGIAFVSFSTSADTELKISTNSTPVAAVVDVDSTNNTDNVVLLKGKMKLDGTSSALLDSLPITLTSTGGGITALTGSVILTLSGGDDGSQTFTESTGTNCVAEADFSTAGDCGVVGTEGLMFDNLDYHIGAGDTVNFTVAADMNDLDATAGVNTNFDAGDTLLAELTTAGRAFIVVENSQGDQLTNSTEMTGNALGKVQTFRDTGIQVSLVSASWVSTAIGGAGTGNPDLGTYQMTFDVTAFGGDMYVDGTKPTLAGTNSIDLDIIPATGGTGTLDADIVSVSSPVATMTGTINTTSRFLVSEGETQRFKITAVITPTVAGGLYSMSLASLAYNSADVDITDALPALEYTTNLTDFVTNSANLKLTN